MFWLIEPCFSSPKSEIYALKKWLIVQHNHSLDDPRMQDALKGITKQYLISMVKQNVPIHHPSMALWSSCPSFNSLRTRTWFEPKVFRRDILPIFCSLTTLTCVILPFSVLGVIFFSKSTVEGQASIWRWMAVHWLKQKHCSSYALLIKVVFRWRKKVQGFHKSLLSKWKFASWHHAWNFLFPTLSNLMYTLSFFFSQSFENLLLFSYLFNIHSF